MPRLVAHRIVQRDEPAAPPAPAEQPQFRSSVISSIAGATVGASFIGGGIRNAIDEVRLGAALPYAARMGRTSEWIKDTVLLAPEERVITPELLSRSNFQTAMYRSSAVLGVTLGGVQALSGGLSLWAGINRDGWNGISGNREGRSGLFQLLGGGVSMYMLQKAIRSTPAQTGGSALGSAISRVVAASKAPIFGNHMLTNVGIGMAVLTGANVYGFFDWMDHGNTRSVGTVMRDAARNLPMTGSSTQRSMLFGGLGAGMLGLGLGGLTYSARITNPGNSLGTALATAGKELITRHPVMAGIGAIGIGLAAASSLGLFDWMNDS